VKAVPWGHAALVLLEGVIPCLGGAPEVIGGQPSAVRREDTLPTEELLALVEPVEGVLRAVVGGEFELGVAWGCRGSAAMDVRLSAGRGGDREARGCGVRVGRPLLVPGRRIDRWRRRLDEPRRKW
jgi:hypothetical protein